MSLIFDINDVAILFKNRWYIFKFGVALPFYHLAFGLQNIFKTKTKLKALCNNNVVPYVSTICYKLIVIS